MIKDIVILIARGIEGCGVTKHTVEFCNFLKKNNYTFTVISAKDKSWSRKKAHTVENLEQYKFSDPSQIEKVISRCQSADLVVVNSLPSKGNGRGKGHDDKCIEGYLNILKAVDTPFVLIQHDHSKLSINRNAALEESVKKSKVIFAHSDTGDFATIVNSFSETHNLNLLFDDGSTNETPLFTFQPGMDFESIKSKYWKDITEQNHILHKWIGRTTTWKGYDLMINFHTNFLKPQGYITTLEGIEKSPAFLDFKAKHKDNYFDLISDRSDPNSIDLSSYAGKPAVCFGIYNNSEMLERASKTAFCYQLSILHPRFIKHSIEYTHCELAAVGSIPVFRKEYGDACIHRKQELPMTQCKNTGTIWLSETNLNDCVDRINILSKDLIMRDEYRHMAYEFYKSHQDASFIFQELMDKIKLYV